MPREGHDRMLARLTNQQNYFNPRAPRGARLPDTLYPAVTNVISIHVPREGHDPGLYLERVSQGISIHVPREGHDYI